MGYPGGDGQAKQKSESAEKMRGDARGPDYRRRHDNNRTKKMGHQPRGASYGIAGTGPSGTDAQVVQSAPSRGQNVLPPKEHQKKETRGEICR